MDDSNLVGVPVKVVAGGSIVCGLEAPVPVVLEVKPGAELAAGGGEGGVVKRKRGRPPRAQGKLPQPKKQKEEEEEEDVCFICFDGGSLVLCDRKGCPKAYHPACIKRDEAFFRSNAKWNCGWHICSGCQKAAHYMCYMCTYSLCKGCTKDADYFCVRDNKGFCSTCMRIVMMIENRVQGNKEAAQVDFDDKSSWEYLFKVYWIYLKGKLSLTLDELTQAKNRWGGVGSVAKRQSWNVHCSASGYKGLIPDRSSGTVESNSLNSGSTKKQPELHDMHLLSSEKLNDNKQVLYNFSCAEKLVSEKATSLNGCRDWASKDLLEFVACEKNGDISILSQFEVQALLLDYIKRNNLCDPCLESQILCDSRLKNLFGKPRLGHFEMLKLLESHFLIKEDFKEDGVPACVVDQIKDNVKGGANNGNLLAISKDMKHKTCNVGEYGVMQANGDEYAAIDSHNINLIYLRRSLLESLVENSEEFHVKVVGSIVRIRITSNDQKEERHRLVQVVGTSKVSIPYKVGDKMADVMLEVLNLDKKEALSIDSISNQEFSEEECRHLRQSMEFGLVKRLTVGEVQKKAISLLSVRIGNLLRGEILSLNHLHGGESGKGQKKEHGEHLENLEILKIPEIHQQGLHKVPEVHVDKKMDPNYGSEDEAGEVEKEQEVKGWPICSGSSRNEGKEISQAERDKSQDHLRSVERANEGNNASISNRHHADSADSTLDDWNDQASEKSGSFSRVPTETSTTPLSTGNMPSETDKVWHYRDPNGEIQGPFAMFQLRKWSTTNLFPPDMRIWIGDAQNDSVLLTDTLNVQLHNPLLLLWNASLQTQEVGSASDGVSHYSDVNNSMNGTRREKKEDRAKHCNDEQYHSKGTKEIISSLLGTCSSDSAEQNASYEEQAKSCSPDANHNEGQVVSCSPHWDSSKCNSSCSEQSQVHSPLPSATISDCSNVTQSHQEAGHGNERLNPGLNHGNFNAKGTMVCHISVEPNENQSDSLGYSGRSSGPNLKAANFSLGSLSKSTGSSERNEKMGLLNFPSSTIKSSNEDWNGDISLGQQSASSNVLELFSHTSKPSVEAQKVEVFENKSVLANTAQDSGPSQGSISTLVMVGTQLGDREGKCSGESPAASKPSVEEWDSSIISVSSLKPVVVSDHVETPTSWADKHSHSSTSQTGTNMCTWSTIITEPIEFSTLAEESVSDLLAEVDAMEFQPDLASPTSRMRCIEELFQDPRNECFGSIEELSPHEPVNTDVFSSAANVQLPPRSTVIVEPIGASHNVLGPFQSNSRSIASAEMKEETKSTEVLGKRIQLSVSPTLGDEFINTKIPHGEGSRAVDTSWRTVHGNVNMNWEGSAQENTNMGWGIGQASPRGNVNVNHHTSAGSSSCHRKHGGERQCGDRYSGHRDGTSHGGSSGSRGRPSWSRQSYGDGKQSYGDGGSSSGGWYSRPPTKVPRVCKFYGSGRCKKGAMCDYLHP